MARDASLYVRRAVITAWKRDAAVAAIVGARVLAVAESEPVWPFVRYGPALALPKRATGLDGSRLALTGHAFAKDSDTVDGLDQVQLLAAAMTACLEGRTFALGAPWPAKIYDISWTSTQTIEDSEEASAFHAIVNLEALVSS